MERDRGQQRIKSKEKKKFAKNNNNNNNTSNKIITHHDKKQDGRVTFIGTCYVYIYL